MHEKTILIVDDDADVRFGIASRLGRQGYATRIASDGAEALSNVAAEHPDAIVLDVRMPILDGMAVLFELRSSDQTKGIPVIILSASIVDAQRAIDAGARYFIKKPFSGDDLVKAVKTAIAHPDWQQDPHRDIPERSLVTSPER